MFEIVIFTLSACAHRKIAATGKTLYGKAIEMVYEGHLGAPVEEAKALDQCLAYLQRNYPNAGVQLVDIKLMSQ
jgi:hypothetical protein